MGENQRAGRVDLRLRTKQLALRVIRLFFALQRRAEADVIGTQLLRSGTSVGTNFREAHRARSDAEFVSKVGDCLKELDETDYWLGLLIDAEIVPSDRLAPLLEECNQLIVVMTTIAKKANSHAT
jgi:four helix bundle protein